jgi:hypothetical protein
VVPIDPQRFASQKTPDETPFISYGARIRVNHRDGSNNSYSCDQPGTIDTAARLFANRDRCFTDNQKRGRGRLLARGRIAVNIAKLPDLLRNPVNSRPPLKFVAPVCAGTGGAVDFPWRKGVDYDPDSVQYAPDFALHAARFRLQEFLKLLEFRD